MKPPLENTPESEAIRAEIAQTRQRMDQTIGALGERLKGRHLVDEALHLFRTQTQNGNMNKFKDTLTHSADAAARSVVNTVKSNPIPAVLVGAGIALYFYNRSHSQRYAWDPLAADDQGYRYHETLGHEFVGDEAGRGSADVSLEQRPYDGFPAPIPTGGQGVGEKLHEIGDRVRQQAGQVVERAREAGSQVGERSRQLYRQGRQKAASAIEQHPLETGLMCLALGLIAGIALPTSERVRRQVGPQARALRGRVRSVVVGGRQVIRSAAEAARHEAEAQGLTLGALKTGAAAVGQAAKDAGQQTARNEGLMPAGSAPVPAPAPLQRGVASGISEQ